MKKFSGFNKPSSNYSKLPHEFMNLMSEMSSMSELKVVLYILRHTWGYGDETKKITIDEFCKGRKQRNKTTGEISRIDNGTGLSEQGVRDGIQKAIEDGFIVVSVDSSDSARIKKYYSLNMADSEFEEIVDEEPQDLEVKDLEPEVKDLDPRGLNSVPPSEKETNKETKEKKARTKKVKFTEQELKQMDDKVNYIISSSLVADKVEIYDKRSMIPPELWVYADLYVKLTGQTPKKSNLSDWLHTFQNWLADSVTESHIERAWNIINHVFVVRPASLNNTINKIQGDDRLLEASKNSTPPEEGGEIGDYIDYGS